MLSSIWCIGMCPGPSIITWHPRSPGPRREFAHDAEFGELGVVGRVGQTAGAETVPQAPRHVVFLQDIAQVVEPRIEGILPAVGLHPLGGRATRPG